MNGLHCEIILILITVEYWSLAKHQEYHFGCTVIIMVNNIITACCCLYNIVMALSLLDASYAVIQCTVMLPFLPTSYCLSTILPVDLLRLADGYVVRA